LQAWQRREINTKFWYENLKERKVLEEPGTDGKTALNNRRVSIGLAEDRNQRRALV
jgi:hypothetical protein